MTDTAALRSQLASCEAWLKKHKDDKSMCERAIDSVSLLHLKVQKQLNESKKQSHV